MNWINDDLTCLFVGYFLLYGLKGCLHIYSYPTVKLRDKSTFKKQKIKK